MRRFLSAQTPAAVTLISVGILTVASSVHATTAYIQKNSGGTDTATPVYEDTTSGENHIGIGTSSPASGYKLHVDGRILAKTMLAVYGDGAEQGLLVQTGSGSYHALLRLKSPYSDFEILAEGATGTNSLRFYDYAAGAYRMVINSSGNVGVGTTSPSYKLDVNGSGNFAGNLVVDTNVLFVNTSADRVGIGTSSPAYTLDVNGGARFSATVVTYTGAGLQVDGSSLYVDASADKVGIGTTSPAYKLHVSDGDIGISDSNGVILRNGNNCYRLVVNNDGSIAYASGSTTRLPSTSCP